MPCTAKQPNDYLTSVAGLHDQPEVPRACGVGDGGKGVAGLFESLSFLAPLLGAPLGQEVKVVKSG